MCLHDSGTPPVDRPRRLAVPRGDSNETIEHSTGQRAVSEVLVRGWQRLLEYRHAWLAARGIRYVHVVVPNKEVVYSRFLPAELPPISPERLLCRVANRLATTSGVALVNVLPELLAASVEREVYAKTDTHWNGFGAYHVYRAVIDAIGIDIRDVVGPERLAYSTTQNAGDIGSKLDPPVKSEFLHCGVRVPRARVVSDNGVANNGRIRRTVRPESSGGPKLLVFHDSFHNWTLPFFAESFAETVSVHNFQMDHDIVDQERPDVVITELTERFMARLPDDLMGTSTADFVRMKAAGEVAANL